MENQVTILQNDSIEAMSRAEVDIQISTAKKYPREYSEVLKKIEFLATLDTETAEDCFYALKRGKGDDAKVIEGLSVRFAEIMANTWGNLRIQTRIIGNDGKTITSQGICHDLESNVAVSVEVKRRITDRFNKTFSEDMQVVTGNAASAIAYRNAVLKVIPKAMTKKIVDNVKQVALGKALDVETARNNAIEYFKKLGVTEKELFEYLEIKTVADIDKEKLFILKGLKNALKEGDTSIDETFRKKNHVTLETPQPKSTYQNEIEIQEDVLRGSLTPEQAQEEIAKLKAGK